MREELKKINGQRELFRARLVKQGVKSSSRGSILPTILLKDVRRVSDGKLMCEHLWLNKTKAFSALNLSVGVELQFAARVKPYTKGYQGRKEGLRKEIEEDFKLSHPTQVEILESLAKKEERSKSELIIRKNKRV